MIPNFMSANGLRYLQVNSDRKSQTSVSDLSQTQPTASILILTDELFECVLIFYGLRLNRNKVDMSIIWPVISPIFHNTSYFLRFLVFKPINFKENKVIDIATFILFMNNENTKSCFTCLQYTCFKTLSIYFSFHIILPSLYNFSTSLLKM